MDNACSTVKLGKNEGLANLWRVTLCMGEEPSLHEMKALEYHA